MDDISVQDMTSALQTLEKATNDQLRDWWVDIGFKRPTVHEQTAILDAPEKISPNRREVVRAYHNRVCDLNPKNADKKI